MGNDKKTVLEMKNVKTICLITIAWVFSCAVSAEEASIELATERGCFVCHTIHQDEDVMRPLAPSYQEIAERYRGRDDAFEYLVNRVLHCTLYAEQNWADEISMRFMPPNVNTSRLEAGAMTDWILNLPEDRELRDRLAQHEAMVILSTRSGCASCHLMDPSPDQRLMPLAPAYREIAARYRDEDGAQEMLTRSILQGTRSATKIWPNVNMQFMPPSVALKREDAEKLAGWILELE